MMIDRARRKELVEAWAQDRPEAGVYTITNSRSGKVLLGSSPNLPGTRNRLAFAQSTGAVNGLDPRLAADAREFGIDVFAFEVVDTLDTDADTTDAGLRDDLVELESLWRDRLDASNLY